MLKIIWIVFFVLKVNCIFSNTFVDLVNSGKTKEAILLIQNDICDIEKKFSIKYEGRNLIIKPIHLAILRNDSKLFNFLLKNNVNIESKIEVLNSNFDDLDFASPLHLAIIENNYAMATLLLDNGANGNVKNKWQDTPLHLAVLVDFNLVKLLAKYDVRIDEKDYLGNTPLHNASTSGDWKAILLLLHFQANVNSKNHDEETPLHIAVLNHHKKAVNLLIKHDANLNAINAFGESILHYGIKSNNIDIINFLLTKNININALNNENKTPLDYCFSFEVDKKIIEILKNNGANHGRADPRETDIHRKQE